MIATRPTRSFLSSRKEGRAMLHRASGSWKCGPRVSADLVNRPQDFPLDLHGDGVLCMVRSFNVRTSLLWFRTVSVLSQGVHGARPRAMPSCSAHAFLLVHYFSKYDWSVPMTQGYIPYFILGLNTCFFRRDMNSCYCK